MACARRLHTTPRVRPGTGVDALTPVDPRSAPPAFKNLGRGVF
jgi:hypothetical protein